MKLSVSNLLLCMIVFTACNNKATTTSILNTSNLQSSFINIDADSAYTLQTAKGSVIKIAAGTFTVPTGQKVNIEIKEAFTMQDILLAGLSTESNGKPLLSGGMIYFNASSNGTQLEFNKPVEISMPSAIYDPAMQLYKGEIKDDSSINWITPQALDTTPNAEIILAGKEMFRAKCRSCHKVFHDFTGPAMMGLSLRAPNRQWIYDFIRHPAQMIETDPYAHQLFDKWKPTVMTGFPQLTNQDIDAIMAYVSNAEKLGLLEEVTLPDYSTETATVTDCGYDTIFTRPAELDNSIDILPDTPDNPIAAPLLNDTIPESNNIISSGKPVKASATEGLGRGFTDAGITTGMYDFTIETNGWYNVDAEVEGYEGSTEVMLSVKINGTKNGSTNVYLFCPSRKMLSVGMEKSPTTFKFEKINGKIPLFLGDDAVIIAFGSDNDKMLYGTKQFKVAKSQEISIQLKESSETEINAFIKKNRIDGIKIDAFKKEYEVKKKICDDYYPGSDTTKYYP